MKYLQKNKITFKLRGDDLPQEQSFMKANLNFNEYHIETAYKNCVLGYQQKSLRFFQGVTLLIMVTNWLLNPLDDNNFTGPSLFFNLFAVMFHLLIAIYLKYKKDFKHPQLGIFMLQVGNCIGNVEVIMMVMNQLTRTNFICISIILEMNCLVSMIARSSWKINGLSSILTSTYLNLRFANLEDNKEMRGLPTIVFIGNFLIITLGAYFHEKYDRNLFYQRYSSEKSLKQFEEIIKEVLPSSIIIYKGNELKFFNQETKRMLKVENVKEVEEELRKVIITSSEFQGSEEINLSVEENKTLEKKVKSNEIDPYLFNYLTRLASLDKIKRFLSLTGQYRHKTTGSLKFIEEAGGISTEGEIKYLDIKAGRIAWEGSESLIVILSEDFAQHRLQYYQEQVKYKDKLLATVSHDLRTPLNGIIGILDLTLENDLDKAMKKSLQLALRSSNLLLFMINDILDFSQIANGRLSLTPVNFSIEEIVGDVTKLIKFQAKNKGIAFEVKNHIAKEDSYLLYNDPNRLKQVILNLLGNAVKFTQKGFVSISIELDKSNNDAITANRSLPPVRITVNDSGCGIKEEDIPKLFKLFGRLKSQENKKINSTGVGLGLAISQNLVRILNSNRKGAEISVNSVYGKGTTFSFPLFHYPEVLGVTWSRTDLPRFNDPQPEIRINRQNSFQIPINEENHNLLPPKEIQPKLHVFKKFDIKKRVLIVDDDQINILVLSKFFDKFEDCLYFTAFNGEEALDLITKKAKNSEFFDIIFMDCNMPLMDGFEATRRIMGLVSTSEIPKLIIIASTANVSESDKDQCYQCGMVDFISKPFKSKEIREKIDLYANIT